MQYQRKKHKLYRYGSLTALNVQKNTTHKSCQFVNEYKLSRGCKVCGYNKHPAALELNHIDPSSKSFQIAQALASNSMTELEKCEVKLPSNPHL
jgi:hypothetical protein